MDRYLKGVLTVIAIGIIGINIKLWGGAGIISEAQASMYGGTPVEIIYIDQMSASKIGMAVAAAL